MGCAGEFLTGQGWTHLPEENFPANSSQYVRMNRTNTVTAEAPWLGHSYFTTRAEQLARALFTRGSGFPAREETSTAVSDWVRERDTGATLRDSPFHQVSLSRA